MRVLTALLIVAAAGVTPALAADSLADARRLYNLGQYDTAARHARDAMKVPASAEAARLVLGRIHLERYRRTADSADLAQAREALRAVNPQGLERRERAELTIGLGQALFLEDRFGPAAELFERAQDSSVILGPAAHERLLDWWATAVDRLALSKARDQREPVYARVVARMEKELAHDPWSAAATYWLAAAARGSGNLERAWNAAMAGWLAGVFANDHGAQLRADLDRLVVHGIIPDRAVRMQPREPRQATAVMMAEWEALKASWTR